MIIDIEPGSRVKVPTDSDFLVRTATPFSSGELIAVLPQLNYRRFDGGQGVLTGQVSGTDFLFLVTPGLFDPGEWTVNPSAIVNAKKRSWPEPAILVFGDPLTEGNNCRGC